MLLFWLQNAPRSELSTPGFHQGIERQNTVMRKHGGGGGFVMSESCDPVDCSLPGSSVHGFSRQEYSSGLPFPSPGDPPNPGVEPRFPGFNCRQILYQLSYEGSPRDLICILIDWLCELSPRATVHLDLE